MTGVTSTATGSGVYVRSGGGTIDDNGQAITIGQILLAPTGNGVTSISTSDLTSTSYIAAPRVRIVGGNSDATAVAILSDRLLVSAERRLGAGPRTRARFGFRRSG